ncbi:MAG: hypothetical protein V1903_12840 [Bacteroidota bacterium]
MNKIIFRNTIISSLLIVALFAIVVLRDRSPYGKNQSLFAVVPKNEITRIDLAQNDKNISLVKENRAWLVEGKETRKSAVLYLVRILTEMQIKSPVSEEIFMEEIMDNGVTPVKVRVYEGNRVLRTFLVYPTGSNTFGNIMKMSGRSRPFIVYVPGYEEDIGYIFNSDEHFWQPFTIFNLLPSEIASVTVESHADTASSFSIISSGSSFMPDGISGWDSTRVKRYISYFTWVPFENRAYSLPGDIKEEIMSQQPLYTITVKISSGEEVILKLWRKYEDQTGEPDSDRLYGKASSIDDLLIIRYFDIDPLLKKRSYFYQ